MTSPRRWAVSAALALSVSGIAMPAHAAVGDLPATDGIFTLNCDRTDPDIQLYSIDPDTAAFTRVGTGLQANTNTCAMGVVRDPTTGIYYTIAWVDIDPSDPGYDYGLVTVDPDDGAIAVSSGISLDGNTEWSGPYQICFDADGALYGLGRNTMWSIDKVSGVATPLGDYTNSLGGIGGCKLNPLDGKLYVTSFVDSGLYTLDVDTLTFSSVGTLPFSNGQMFDFDSDGNIWLQNWNDLLTGSLDDLANAQVVAAMKLDGANHNTQSLFVQTPWSPPSDHEKHTNEPLAETGFDAVSVLVGAVIALGGGVALARRRRRV